MRHGMTNWNFDGRVQGGLDKSRLNQIGMRQARRAGQSMRHISPDTIFCSPLTRARDTLRIAANESENPAILEKKPQLLDALIEIQVPWQGLHKRDISKSMFSDAYELFLRNPMQFSYNGFNPIRDIERRAKDVWHTVAKSEGSCHLVVSHNQMNKALICTALGVQTKLSAWRQENCCFNVVMLQDGKNPKLRLMNGGSRGLQVSGNFATSTKTHLRKGCVRVFMHQTGDSNGLQREVQRAGYRVQHFYLIGDVTVDDLGQLNTSEVRQICSQEPCHAIHDEHMYHFALSFLEKVRCKHANKCIVISVNDAMGLRAFFSASLGLGLSGMRQLQSDAGGVSIVDIRSSKPMGSTVSFVEAFNVGAWSDPDCLFGYTLAA